MTSHVPHDGSFKNAFVLHVCSAFHGDEGQSCSPGGGLGPAGHGHDLALRACEPGHRPRGSGPSRAVAHVPCVLCQELAFLPVSFTGWRGRGFVNRVPAPGDQLGAE